MFAPIEGIGEDAWGVSWFEHYKKYGPQAGSRKASASKPIVWTRPCSGPAATEPAWSLWGRTALKLPFELVR